MTIDPRLRRIVAAQPYPLLFATISGAHLYGFPSPDSDFDLRGAEVYISEHVKVDKGRKFLRVHYHVANKDRPIVVGRRADHLDTAATHRRK